MTIRNVPDATRDRLAERAARSGRSLQEYLRSRLIDMADRPTTDEWLDQVRGRLQESGGASVTAEEIVRTVREIRDER